MLLSAAFYRPIEEGFLQAERGEFIEGEEVRLEIRTMKEQWHAGLPSRDKTTEVVAVLHGKKDLRHVLRDCIAPAEPNRGKMADKSARASLKPGS
jgi:hypothetical protein